MPAAVRNWLKVLLALMRMRRVPAPERKNAGVRGAEPVSSQCVVPQLIGCAVVQWDQPGFAELGVPDGQGYWDYPAGIER
jgi:hypothetical protein